MTDRNPCGYPEGCRRKRHGVYCVPPPICKAGDCGRVATRHGLCKLHDRRLQVWGEPFRWIKAMVEWSLAEGDVGCITDWPYGRNRGYPVVTVDRRTTSGSVLVMELTGRPKPVGQEARHLCGNGKEGCLSPWHLDWGTHYQNIQDMVGHGTMPRGERTGSAKLTEQQVREIRASGGTQRAVAVRYGIDQSIVNRIRNGKAWRHVD